MTAADFLSQARQIQAAAPPRPRTTPFPEETSILGVIYGVLLCADMNAATPLGAWGRSCPTVYEDLLLVQWKLGLLLIGVCVIGLLAIGCMAVYASASRTQIYLT